MGYTIELYDLDVVNEQFVIKDIIIEFQGLTFTKKRKGFGSCTFSLNVDSSKSTYSNFIRYVTQVLIKKDGVPLWLGFVDKVTGSYNNVSGYLNVQCLEYFAHLRTRYTGQLDKYKNIQTTVIYSGLVEEVQERTNGTLLINNGTMQTIGAIDETLEYAEVAQAIINQANNINGFDFEILPVLDSNSRLSSVTFNIYKGMGTTRNDLPRLELGVNVQRVDFATQDRIINSLTALGSGTGTSVLLYELDSEDSQRGYTRKEEVAKFASISVLSSLSSKATSIINTYGGEQFDINVEIKPNTFSVTDFDIGDTLNMYIVREDSYINFSGYRTVIEKTVSVNQEGTEFIIPKLSI
jgi:hypothetical protein